MRTRGGGGGELVVGASNSGRRDRGFEPYRVCQSYTCTYVYLGQLHYQLVHHPYCILYFPLGISTWRRANIF